MANKKNDRRKGEKRNENGPRWENKDTDRNSAHSRTKWKRRAARSERRTGSVTPKFQSMTKGSHNPSRHRYVEGNMFKQFDDYESSTRVCPCGASYTWSGFDDGLDKWMAEHQPHADNAEVKSQVTADGMRAYETGEG